MQQVDLAFEGNLCNGISISNELQSYEVLLRTKPRFEISYVSIQLNCHIGRPTNLSAMYGTLLDVEGSFAGGAKRKSPIGAFANGTPRYS